MDSTSVNLTNQFYSDIKDVLKGLSESLQVGAEHVYEILVRQQFVNSISNIGIYILFIVGLSACLFWNISISKKRKTFDEEDEFIASMFISIILLISFIICLCATFPETITGFVNPEYAAIKEILELVKNGN